MSHDNVMFLSYHVMFLSYRVIVLSYNVLVLSYHVVFLSYTGMVFHFLFLSFIFSINQKYLEGGWHIKIRLFMANNFAEVQDFINENVIQTQHKEDR